MRASVIVCTFNRAALLGETLVALRTQQAPEGGYEIVVVDNNSADDTRAVTERLAAVPGAPVRYILEKQQGLSFARNTGIRAAHGDIVAFVDDDVDVKPEWLCALLEPLSDPRVACTGGPVRPIWSSERPPWLTKDWEGYLGITEFEQVRETGHFGSGTYPWGLNIAFRREIFEEVGLFPTDLGRIGTGLLSNEEISVCRRIDAAGHKIRLAPEAIVYHKIPKERLNKRTFYRRVYYQGRSDAVIDQGSAAATYARIRKLAAYVWSGRLESSADVFDMRCRRRLFIGYLSSMIGVQHDANSVREYRKLRGLSELAQWLEGQAVANDEQFRDVANHRDQLLAGHDDLTTDRDNWRRLAQDREAELVGQVATIDQLRHAVHRLERTVWVRLGARLGLVGSSRSRGE